MYTCQKGSVTMDQDFRKKTFRGAKIEDMILELENLSALCEGKSQQSEQTKTDASETCSFCQRSKEEVGELAMGPGVSICKSCLEFGVEVLNAPAPNS